MAKNDHYRALHATSAEGIANLLDSWSPLAIEIVAVWPPAETMGEQWVALIRLHPLEEEE